MAEPLRVLIVEDSENDARLLVRELERAGYAASWERVETAGSMRSALEGRSWDLIIADYTMPKFSAPAALALLQDMGLDLPFIIVSGSVGEDAAVEGMRAGAHDYFLKGNLKRLVPAIQRELEQAGQRRARRKAEKGMRGAEDTLRRSEERRRALMEHALDAILVLSPDGTILEANRAAETLVERPRREQLGRSFLELLPAEERDAVAARFGRMLETGYLHDSSSVLRTDGRTIPIEVSASRVDVGGEPLILAIVRDVSERRQLERQLRQSQKIEAIGQLAGGIAHDFNNLLTAILGYAGLLATQAGQGSPLSESIGEIRKAGERAASLTQQLLAFSRRQVLLPEILDLNGIVTEMHNMLRRLIGEDVELIRSCAPDLAEVKADRGQIEQVLMNLVVNARDAMPKGGKLTIETANVALDESYVRNHAVVQPGPYVLLAVSDTGVGMDADTLSHMFEPFFTTKEKGKGTGLGLATVYGIVKQSGGYVWVYSEPGHGTTFKIYLPRVEEKQEAPRRAAPAVAKDVSGSETILLVEDEEAVRRLVRMVLEGKGYTVLEASGWQEALEIAGQQKTIHLVVTDVVMPGVGGPELASRLEVARPGIRVLYMSGYTDSAVVNHGLVGSAAAFLQKPFTPDVLLRKVREVLSS